MKKSISILLMVCMLFALSIPCAALANWEEYGDSAWGIESGEGASYEASMDFEPMWVVLDDPGVSFAVPANFTENAVPEDVAVNFGLLRSFTSAEGASQVNIRLIAPAAPEESIAMLKAYNNENIGWIHVNGIPYLTYSPKDSITVFAANFNLEEGYALEFHFTEPFSPDLGNLREQILSTLRYSQ